MSTVCRLTFDHQIQPTDYGLFSSKEKAMEFMKNNIFGSKPIVVDIDTPDYVKINGNYFGGDFIIKTELVR